MSPEPSLPLPKPVQGRRTLLRSMFVAPALTTVASGSALAATSLTCAMKQTQSPIFPPVSTSPDGYLRIELAKLQKNTDSSKVKYYVPGSVIQLLTVVNVEPSYKNSMNGRWVWFIVDSKDGAVNTESGLPFFPQPAKTDWTYYPTSGRFAVLRFNSAGQVVGVGMKSGSGTSALAHTCMNSIMA